MAIVESAGSLVSTYRQWSQPQMSYGISLYSGRVQDYAALYKAQPNLRIVIRFLARNIAQLGLKAYRRKSDSERLPLEEGHDLARFLKNPTPSLPRPTTRHVWIRNMIEDLALYDSLFELKLRNPNTQVLNAIRIPPPMIAPVGDSFLWPDGFKVSGILGEKTYDNDAVFYMHGHNPSDPRIGVSSVESLRQILAEEAAAGEYREQFWRNGARMSGVIERPADAPKWSDAARNRFTSDWRASRTGSGPDAGGTPILEDGMQWKDAAFSAKDSEYLGARRLTREECAAAYFIPPVFVGILENANFSNIKEQHVSLYADTLGPWLDWLTLELEAQMLPEFTDVDDVYLEFNIEEKLRGRFEEQAAAIQTSTGAPWLTRNEARSLRNLPAIDGADELVVPLNVLVGGQASPTDSAPPALASRSAKGTGGAYTDLGVVHAKAGLPANLTGWQAKHVEILNNFAARQSASVLARLGAGQDLDEAFDRARWDGELRTDLLAVSLAMTDDVGSPLAAHYGTEFDLARTEAWLGENARIAAEGINGATYDELAEAWSGVSRRGANARTGKAIAEALTELGLDLPEDELDDFLGGESFLNPAREVFGVSLLARIPTIATTRSTTVGQWARREAASQAGVRSKTWRSSGSPESRHASLNGETVPLGQPFSNGAQYPGDPVLGIEQTAGCLCSLDFP